MNQRLTEQLVFYLYCWSPALEQFTLSNHNMRQLCQFYDEY